MNRFTRREIADILELDEEFLGLLESESILYFDQPESDQLESDQPEGDQRESGPGYSLRMLERARVAHSLVVELDVNLAGVAVIVRMREDVTRLRGQLRTVAEALREQHDEREE